MIECFFPCFCMLLNYIFVSLVVRNENSVLNAMNKQSFGYYQKPIYYIKKRIIH